MTVRVRIRGDAGYLTLKGPCRGLTRDEFEYRIPLADATRLLAEYCGGRCVRKTRFQVPFGGHLFEVDIFEGRHAGLVIAEVELRCETERVALPRWLGPEVTHDRRYGNFALAQPEAARPPADRPTTCASAARPAVAPAGVSP
jgi:CYTH domain-containing protein